ncbi:hypothetical protein OH76DRAFT_1366365, partial [Lentinus brumalis]
MHDDIDDCRIEHLFISCRTFQPFILVALLVTSTLHTVSGLNREAADLVLLTMRAVLTGAFIACNKAKRRNRSHSPPLTPEQQAMLDSVPRDIRTALSHLKVEPNIIRYATC